MKQDHTSVICLEASVFLTGTTELGGNKTMKTLNKLLIVTLVGLAF